MEFTARDRLKLLTGAAALTFGGCGGGSAGSNSPVVTAPTTPTVPSTPTPYSPAIGAFREKFQSRFVVGAAIAPAQIAAGRTEADILTQQFSSITAENVMKPDALSPSEGTYTFDEADALLSFAQDNNIALRGHTLLWHRATPDYFFEGPPNDVKARLQNSCLLIGACLRNNGSVLIALLGDGHIA